MIQHPAIHDPREIDTKAEIDDLYREVEFLVRCGDCNSKGNGYDRMWAENEYAGADAIMDKIKDLENNLPVLVLAEGAIAEANGPEARESITEPQSPNKANLKGQSDSRGGQNNLSGEVATSLARGVKVNGSVPGDKCLPGYEAARG